MRNAIVASDRAALYELADEWKAYLDTRVEAQELSPATRKTYQAALNRFLAWSETAPLDESAPMQWKLSISHLKPNTVNVWLAGVRSFFDWCVDERHIQVNPFARIKGAKRRGTMKKHLRDPLDDNEVRTLIQAIDTSTPDGVRNGAIIHLMLYCALRTVEICRANYENLRTQDGKLLLDVQGKGRFETDEFVVVAHRRAIDALTAWLDIRGQKPGALFTSFSQRSVNERLGDSAIRHIVKAHFRKAGVISSRKTTHSLRHTAITKAARNGAPLVKAQSMARHENIESTMIYYHEADRVEDPAEGYIDYEE